MVDATTQQEQERYNALVAEKARLANELNVMQSQGILWNDPRYQSTQQQYGYVTQQIPLAYERQKSAQNIEAGIIGSSGYSPMTQSTSQKQEAAPTGNLTYVQQLQSQGVPVTALGNQLAAASYSPQQQYNRAAENISQNPQTSAPQNQAQVVSILLQRAGFSAESARIAGDTTARSTTSAYTTQYTPYGERTQQELLNTRVAVDPRSGEIGYYQVPINPMTGLPRTGVYGAEGGGILIGGGSRSAAQSGMFSTGVAGTPDIRTQYNPEKYAPTANVAMATIVRSSPESFSRLGAEAYSGQVAPLDSRTLTPESQVSRYPAWTGNLANLAQQVAPSKSEYGGAYIPWAVPLSSPDTMYMGERGITGAAPSAYNRMASMEYAGPLFGMGSRAGIQNPTIEGARLIIGGSEGVRYGESIAAPSDRLIGSGKVASIGTTVPTTPSPEASLPTWESQKSKFTAEQQRFIQFGLSVSSKEAERAFTPTTTETIQPTGEIPFFGVVPGVSTVVAQFQPVTTVTKSGFGEVRASGETPFATFVSDTNRGISTGLGLDQIPSPTTEQIKKTGPFMAAFGVAPIAVALETPVVSDYTAAYLKGEFESARTKPVETTLSLGAGAAMGVIFRGAEVGVAASRATFAERAFTEGGFYRGVDMFSGKVLPVAGAALGGVYAIDVGIRSTSAGRDLSPMAAERFGGIVATEARPMGIGAMLGYAAPGVVSRSVKLSDIGYRSSVQEGRSAGRLQYYITEPITTPVRSVYTSGKEFVTSTRATGGNPITEGIAIARFKADYAYRSTIDIPIRSALQEAPGMIERAGVAMQMPFVRARVEGVPKLQASLASKYIDIAYAESRPISTEISRKPIEPENEFATGYVYGKQRTVFDYPRLAEIKVKSYWQENKPDTRDLMILLREPKEEIRFLNQVAKMQGERGGVGGAAPSSGFGPATGGAGATRVVTRVVGGRATSGLSAEPSLKSMGVSEKSVSPPSAASIGSRADFRGRAGAMKPMGEFKRAGLQQSVMTEQLPVPEGMTTGIVRQPKYQTAIRPRFGLASEEEYGQEYGVASISISSQMQSISTRRTVESMSSYDQMQQQRVGVSQIGDLAKASIQEISGIRTTDLRREFGVVRTPETSFRYDITTGPIVTTTPAQRITTIPRQTTPPFEPSIVKKPPGIITPPPAKLVPGAPVLPFGGGRGSPFRGARYRSTAAQYRVGADILGATRGSFQPLRMPKRMSFRMPKF